jgi:hypothetical protein
MPESTNASETVQAASGDASTAQAATPEAQAADGREQTPPIDYRSEYEKLHGKHANLLDEVKGLREKAKTADQQKQAELEQQQNYKALWEQQKADLEKERTERARVERDMLTTRIAAEFKLSSELAKRLVGSTEEELRADAAELAKVAVPPKAPNTEAGAKGTTPPPPTKPGEGKQPNQNQQKYRFQTPGEVAW